MTWARLDDSFPEHPKVAAISDKAFRLHVTGICYAARNLTDGQILKAVLPMLAGTRKLATELTEAGLWESTPAGWTIHDYLDYNPSRADLEERRGKRQAAGREGGKASGQARGQALASHNGRSKPEANALALASTRDEAPTRARAPDPSRPVPSPASYEAVVSGDDDPLPVREIRDTVLSKLPQKYQRDGLTIDEVTDYARDFAGQHQEVAEAIRECRRNNELPFPGNLRKYQKPHGGTSSAKPAEPHREPPPPQIDDVLEAIKNRPHREPSDPGEDALLADMKANNPAGYAAEMDLRRRAHERASAT